MVIMEPSIAGFFRKVNEAENLFGRLAMTGGVWYSFYESVENRRVCVWRSLF